MISYTQLETVVLIVARKTYQGLSLHGQPMPCRLEGRSFKTQRPESLAYLLTVHHYSHALDKTVDDLEGLRCSYPSLVQGEPVQPFKYRLNVLLSTKELLGQFFCMELGQVI